MQHKKVLPYRICDSPSHKIVNSRNLGSCLRKFLTKTKRKQMCVYPFGRKKLERFFFFFFALKGIFFSPQSFLKSRKKVFGEITFWMRLTFFLFSFFFFTLSIFFRPDNIQANGKIKKIWAFPRIFWDLLFLLVVHTSMNTDHKYNGMIGNRKEGRISITRSINSLIKKPSTRQESNPWPLNDKACALSQCYNRCAAQHIAIYIGSILGSTSLQLANAGRVSINVIKPLLSPTL